MNVMIKKLLQGQAVEWQTLGEVVKLEKGKQLNKELLFESGLYPAYNGGVSYSGFTDIYNYEENTIIISQGGASAGFVNFVTTKFYANAHCYVVLPKNEMVENRFIYHFLKLNQEKMMTKQHGAGIPALRTNEILTLKIPIPPLSVQSQIVQILDTFTELTEQLTEQLTAELSMRQKQYPYYRDLLLSEHELAKVGFEWKSLGEVAKYSNDRILFSELDENNHIGVDNLLQNRMGKIPSNHVPEKGTLIKYVENDILIGNIRPYLKKIWQADQVGGTNGDVLVIHPTDKQILPRFLYQVLADDKFFAYNMQHAKGAKMPRGNKQSILKYPIPIPPLSVQSQIVAILDTFDTLTQSISEGLPKEIQLRQKQYEYYRELLLGFPMI